uniref:Uncharacterized protein n=1 Tax=Ananas comosus var. bracteatus TaxID=296719 RepID=A0A6V7Q013_ANACO|nr:unnamed protein product [Ananas comosus var. bracteatus]
MQNPRLGSLGLRLCTGTSPMAVPVQPSILYRYKTSLVPVQVLLQAIRELTKNSNFGILVPSLKPTPSGCVLGVGTLSTTLQKLWKGSTHRSNTRILQFAKIQCITVMDVANRMGLKGYTVTNLGLDYTQLCYLKKRLDLRSEGSSLE